MSLSFSLKQLRCLFISRDSNEDYRQIAANAAQQCMEKALKRLNRDSESWSAAQLRGYLRATATPWIDSTLEKILPQHRRISCISEQVRSLSLDILEQLVVQRLSQRVVDLPAKSAAA